MTFLARFLRWLQGAPVLYDMTDAQGYGTVTPWSLRDAIGTTPWRPEPPLVRCGCGMLFPEDGKDQCVDCRMPAPAPAVTRMPERRRA